MEGGGAIFFLLEISPHLQMTISKRERKWRNNHHHHRFQCGKRGSVASVASSNQWPSSGQPISIKQLFFHCSTPPSTPSNNSSRQKRRGKCHKIVAGSNIELMQHE